jgi:hypothetical protein
MKKSMPVVGAARGLGDEPALADPDDLDATFREQPRFVACLSSVPHLIPRGSV